MSQIFVITNQFTLYLKKHSEVTIHNILWKEPVNDFPFKNCQLKKT